MYLTIAVPFSFMKKIIAVLFVAALSGACNHKVYQADKLTYNGYRITKDAKQSAAVTSMLKPYSDSVNSTMNGTIGIAAVSLEKKSPEGSLGNFMTDAMLQAATNHFKRKVDGAFTNTGGIRLTQIPAGPITTGKIFELMPFDNLLIIQEMKGSMLQTFLDHVSGRGGWPVAGITYDIKNKKAVNVLVNGKPIDDNATYTIANSDYVANGGDDCVMLKSLPQINDGFLIRDALIEYVKAQTAAGKTITAKEEGRVKTIE